MNEKRNMKYVCILMERKYQSKSVSVSELIPSEVIFDVSVGCSGPLDTWEALPMCLIAGLGLHVVGL